MFHSLKKEMAGYNKCGKRAKVMKAKPKENWNAVKKESCEHQKQSKGMGK